ncbi:MAG: ABC transporter ATP-binding protein [Dehalococcoidia bacterium]|nr:ABC transporter ATP-binding protein [Dehalococcoidia bacterium]
MKPAQKTDCDQPNAIEIEGLSFAFGKTVALRSLSLAVPRGITFGLLGPNGSGKTTLIRLMVGLLLPQSGSIRVLGATTPHTLSRLIGYMPQLPALYLDLSVEENLDFFARIYGLDRGKERRERIRQTLELVELWERHRDPVFRLSGGMRQRVSLACALVHKPALLVLDEPTVGLDPEVRVGFWEHFHSLARNGATLIISSHTMDDAAHCDRLAFLRMGDVIAEGTPGDLRKAAGRPDGSLEDAFLYFVRRGAGT